MEVKEQQLENLKVTIVDADSICYVGGKDETLMEHLEKVDLTIDNIIKATKPDALLICLSKGPYFRHEITKGLNKDGYKAHRQYTKKYVKLLKEYLYDEYNGYCHQGVEADDLVVYFKNKFPSWKISAIDSDVLKSVVGTHYNYRKDDFVTTLSDEIDPYFKKQLISGQTKDNILTSFPESCGEFHKDLDFDEILIGYIDGFQYETPTKIKKTKDGLGVSEGIKRFALNYRLLKLLSTEEDYQNENLPVPELTLDNLYFVDNDDTEW